ncbi:MAG TPA: MMPL family transporter [Solirubrobacteraceae bacterium]|jgi:RND superfamily putative drug exporter|nr:MMPL family transporter [Solirubrobacteraceae bacterium]
MTNIARWTMRHRRIVVTAWIVAAIGVFAVSSAIGKKTASSFTLPGTNSQQAVDLLQSRFPAQAGDADQIVFQAKSGKLTDAADRAAIDATLARVAKLGHVTGVVSPYAAGQHAISRDGTIAFATVTFDERADALPKAAVESVISTAESARSAQLDVQLGGQAIEQAQQASLGFATVIGILAAIVILLISFGSFTAMGLPIATALLGLGAGIGVINLASHIVDMPSFASELALMIGLGVGVDYALFIVTRFRENYRTNGGNVESAVEAALNTSGRAVLFAGATVVIALLGMFALGVSLLNGAAVAAAIGVVLVLAASLTLLPALLRVSGRRIGETVRGQTGPEADGERPGFWLRWVQRVQRRPAMTAIAATALMLVLAAPALGLRLASSDASNDPASQTTHKAYDLLAKGFGRGVNGPLQLAVALPQAHDSTALTEITHTLRSTPGIASVASPRLNPAGDTASVVAYPTTSPQSSQTSSLVTHLRDSVIPPVERSTGSRVYVGGATASQVDFSHVLSSKLPLFIGVVIALAGLLLLVVFRSLVIPVQAAIMNLLSIGASLGIIQAVFERGWLGGQAGPIDAFIPVLVFAIVFGLSMDYEVFLISRVHEEWQARGDASAAIREGLARTGRVITAAAAVMVAVFGAFAISGDRILEMFGLAMASAVLLDALVVRMLLLPAVLQLLGRNAWWLPRWLDRMLPRVAIEPEAHPAPRPALEPAFEVGS